MLKRSITAWLLVAVMLLSAVPVVAKPGAAVAAPGPRISPRAVTYQSTPDWMPPETAAQLDVGIDVLVPLSIPAPFSGVPQVSASSGYYSLYWFVGGGAPTLLQITGTAGGEIPAYSKYDRNVELVANASVNGATAYRDQTPIYDLVYWKVGNVVYSVESQNSSVDSLTLASSLTALAVPAGSNPMTATVTSPDQVTAGDVGTVTVSVSGDATLSTDVGYFTANGQATIAVSGGQSVEWQSPNLTDPVTATFQVIDPSDEQSATAVLDKISGAVLIGARQRQARSQLLAAFVEQLLVDSKRDRDADAAAMNMQIVTWRDRRAANEAFVAGTGDALRTWRQP